MVSDDSGNMLSYGDEKTFTWKHGRELSGMTDDSGTWNFEYNADGLRVYRSNGTTEYKYYYNGDKLTRMVVNGQNITFGYDANGVPQYVLYEGNRYFYLTNLQGDVTAIVSVNGNVVVEYTYDAWGNVLDITGVRADNLGKLNPLRYRGYVYDDETGLYYLQSRYYDPQIGRFINADVYASTGQGLLGNNMFVYCNNNPILFEDDHGDSATIAGGICGAFFGFIGSVIPELTDGEDGIHWNKVLQCTASSAAAGAFAGFIADASIATFGAVPAMLISAAGGAFASGVNSGFVQYTMTGDIDYKKVTSDAILGGITNGLCTGTSSQLDPLVSGVKEGINYAGRQVSAELAYGLNTWGNFLTNDFLPTFVTGFGAWYGGMGYDYLVN